MTPQQAAALLVERVGGPAIARATSYSARSVYDWAQGKREPPWDVAESLVTWAAMDAAQLAEAGIAKGRRGGRQKQKGAA